MTRQGQGPGDDYEGRLLTELKAVVAERGAAAARLEAEEAATAAPAWRRRGPRLALGGGVALAAVATALAINAGGDSGSKAFAVEPQPGGGVRIQIFSLGDPEGVEKALAEAGVASQVNYLEAGMTCREPHYQPSIALLRTLQENQPQPQPWAGFDYESIDGPLTIAIGDYQQRREMDDEIREAVRQGDLSAAARFPSFVIDPTGLRPDQTLVMSSAPTPPGYQQPIPPDSLAESTSGVKIDTVGQVRVAAGEVGPCEPVPASGETAPVRAPQGGWDFGANPYAGWGFGSGPGAAE